MAATARQAKQAQQAKVLRIGVVQDGRIVQERLIRHGQSVTLGESANNTFVIPAESLPRKEYPLFVAGRSGYVLNFTEAMRGKISSGGAVVRLDKLRNDPSVSQEAGSWRLPLTEQDRGKIAVDGVTVLFQFVPPPPVQAVKPMKAMDFRPRLLDDDDPVFLGFLAIFTALAAVLLVWVWNTEPPVSRGLDEMPDRFTKIVMQPEVPEVEPEIDDDLAQEDETKAEQKAEAKAKAEQKAKDQQEKKAESEPGDAVEEAQQREQLKQSVVDKSLTLQMLTTRGENQRGETAEDLFNEDDAGMGDLDEAVKGVNTVEVAGQGGDGLRGGNPGGTDDVDIDPLESMGGGGTELGGGPDVEVAGEVEMGTPDDLADAGDVGAVNQVVERNFNQLTYCYEQQLKNQPDLGGRVEVEWVVRSGRVTSAYVFANTTGSAELGECIVGRISRWRFPDSVQGEILYPFIFKRKG